MQTAKEQEFQDSIESKKRELKKIEDDWKYSFEQTRQKETYEWELKKEETRRKFDSDIQKRISEVSAKEEILNSKSEEFENAKKEVVRLQNELANLSEKLYWEIKEKLTRDFEFEKTMILKDFEMKEKVSELENTNLQTKIDDLVKNNSQLQKLLENATQRIETLASKVVEWNRPFIYEKAEK